ncbi:MAG: hypothetical protein QM669_10030 [Siphonobacter sp.]
MCVVNLKMFTDQYRKETEESKRFWWFDSEEEAENEKEQPLPAVPKADLKEKLDGDLPLS